MTKMFFSFISFKSFSQSRKEARKDVGIWNLESVISLESWSYIYLVHLSYNNLNHIPFTTPHIKHGVVFKKQVLPFDAF